MYGDFFGHSASSDMNPLYGDILSYWRKNEMKYPRLSVLFKYYCSLPASSAAVERTFSQAANIRVWKRCRLKAKKLENLIIINSNKDLLN